MTILYSLAIIYLVSLFVNLYYYDELFKTMKEVNDDNVINNNFLMLVAVVVPILNTWGAISCVRDRIDTIIINYKIKKRLNRVRKNHPELADILEDLIKNKKN